MISLTQAQWRPRSSQSNAFLVRLTCNSISYSDSSYNSNNSDTKHTIKRSNRSTSTN
jgi:hypothetical protein